MKRHEIAMGVAGALLVALGLLRPPEPPPQEEVLAAGGCRVPVMRLDPSPEQRVGTAVVLHGLAASRRVMLTTGWFLHGRGLRVFLLDLPGHGDNGDPFSFARAEECAGQAVEHLKLHGELKLTRTVVVGHSMGAAIAIRLAERFSTAATIAYSPPPMDDSPVPVGVAKPYALPSHLPSNLLVVTAQFDPPRFRAWVPRLMQKLGGERRAEADFPSHQALGSYLAPWATHTGLLFQQNSASEVSAWVDQSLGRPATPPARVFPWEGLALPAGVILLFPLAASFLTKLIGASREEAATTPTPLVRTLLFWLGAATVSAVVLKWFVPLEKLSLYTGGYLASFFLLTGLLLVASKRAWQTTDGPVAARQRASFFGSVLAGALAGLELLLAFGYALLELTDVWMSGARWVRFPFLFVAVAFYCWAEQRAMGSPRRGVASYGARLARFFALRLALWLALAAGVYLLGSGQVLLVLMAMPFAAFSLGQRLGADAVRRRTGSAAAAALFDAILAAWFIAAVFPLS